MRLRLPSTAKYDKVEYLLRRRAKEIKKGQINMFDLKKFGISTAYSYIEKNPE